MTFRKLAGAEAQRDAILSFLSLLLFQVIRVHSKLLLESNTLHQSKEALLKQAKSASEYAKLLLNEKPDSKNKDKDTNAKAAPQKSGGDVKDEQELINEIEGLETRLRLSDQSRDEYKEKLKLVEAEIDKLRASDEIFFISHSFKKETFSCKKKISSYF
ncbi:hypothetical protein RFI_11928 [Reticulomyxa filosa]|uniref:Endoplasmic reticulum transmembrane protein n=1 Tax=Reticulomyxa filosa TaxID=46433 RepID=X6NH34_RETFI|nr:hypothetical protein RFI_11928 [Reticulomyxa filosa]|eukprot:ETO25208.1 hypothetical protein RFI_11928 [Reticulomyxa filosa]